MFQDFLDQASPAQGREHIPQLREALSAQGLNGFLVPRADEYGGENMADYAERLRWLTGFAGSAGTAIILKDKAAIFIDGRYDLQVRDQVDTDLLTPVSILKTTPADWLEQNLTEGDVIGFDPWLYNAAEVRKLEKACTAKGAKLQAVTANPIDAIWTDQPARPKAPIRPHPLELAGELSSEKLKKVAQMLKGKAAATFITQGDSIAWLFNIRGSDVARAPLPLAFAIVTADGTAHLVTDPGKLDQETRAHLPQEVSITAPDALGEVILGLSGTGKDWLLDETLVPYAIRTMIEETGSSLSHAPDACLKLKASQE